MFKWFSSRPDQRSGTIAAAPSPVSAVVGSDDLAAVKETLFFEWATETYGNDEGTKLYRAYLEVQRCNNLMSVRGDFVGARKSLLAVAMAFPDAGAMAVGSYESPPVTDGYRRWLARWCAAYPQPIPKP